MSGYLNRQQFFHTTDAELREGDEIVPAAERGHRSAWQDAPGYDASKVYLTDHNHELMKAEVWGKHTYAVQPVGAIGPDPERDPESWPDSRDDPAAHSWVADRAIVRKKI